jgi:hypothetical protein
MSIIKVQEGQNIFDVIVQQFGELEQLGKFLADNSQVGINDELVSGQEVNINSENLGDEDVKARYIKINFVTNNKDNNFVVSVQDQKQFQNGEGFQFQNGDAFEYN